jgi:hypothetical protein
MEAHFAGQIEGHMTPQHLYHANFRKLKDEEALFVIETLLSSYMTASGTILASTIPRRASRDCSALTILFFLLIQRQLISLVPRQIES